MNKYVIVTNADWDKYEFDGIYYHIDEHGNLNIYKELSVPYVTFAKSAWRSIVEL